jgi:hypothetical protein
MQTKLLIAAAALVPAICEAKLTKVNEFQLDASTTDAQVAKKLGQQVLLNRWCNGRFDTDTVNLNVDGNVITWDFTQSFSDLWYVVVNDGVGHWTVYQTDNPVSGSGVVLEGFGGKDKDFKEVSVIGEILFFGTVMTNSQAYESFAGGAAGGGGSCSGGGGHGHKPTPAPSPTPVPSPTPGPTCHMTPTPAPTCHGQPTPQPTPCHNVPEDGSTLGLLLLGYVSLAAAFKVAKRKDNNEQGS